ncbi:hypothetical protein, partial [uncultured Dubosiella sp.]|uniref:hypothetical protein n=1 Tax=uncultured Dubosiella sp. TaxID=1937011 RepID=UPI00272974C8
GIALEKVCRNLALREFEVYENRLVFVNKGGTACDRRPLRSVAFIMEKRRNEYGTNQRIGR